MRQTGWPGRLVHLQRGPADADAHRRAGDLRPVHGAGRHGHVQGHPRPHRSTVARGSRSFRERLVRVPFDLDHPYWIEDPDFDLEFHVRHIALPQPGDWRQLCIQVARLHSRPLDLDRPLWEMYVIEGLDNVEGVPPGSLRRPDQDAPRRHRRRLGRGDDARHQRFHAGRRTAGRAEPPAPETCRSRTSSTMRAHQQRDPTTALPEFMQRRSDDARCCRRAPGAWYRATTGAPTASLPLQRRRASAPSRGRAPSFDSSEVRRIKSAVPGAAPTMPSSPSWRGCSGLPRVEGRASRRTARRHGPISIPQRRGEGGDGQSGVGHDVADPDQRR